MEKALFIFAGANGSGKTSLYKKHESIFLGMPFVNADEMLRAVTGSNDPSNAKFGQRLASDKIEECFSKGSSFVFETVFSHKSKIDLVKRAKSLGYTVSIYFCHLSDPANNVARVQQRVEQGGHDVPEDKITSRIPRTFENIKTALQFVDDFYLFDNSYTRGHQLVAQKKPQAEIIVEPDAPDWARELIKTGHDITELTSEESPVTLHLVYEQCIRCGRPLRGKLRQSYGVCSICQPKLK
jgi:predicted ABC-type ATPase